MATGAQASDWRWLQEDADSTQLIAQEQSSRAAEMFTYWRDRAERVGAADAGEPITIKGGVRHPVIYYSNIANRPWSLGPLFCFLFMVSALLKLCLPRLVTAATNRCRTNFFASLSTAFIYATVLITLIRFAFLSEDLTAMGVFIFGLLQLSFALGSILSVNLFAQNLYNIVASKKEPHGAAVTVFVWGGCLVVAAAIITAISLIPMIGPLPRLGNRMVMLLATLGLGGLVHLIAGTQRQS